MNQDNIIRKGKATQRKVKPHRFLFRELIITSNSELFYGNLSNTHFSSANMKFNTWLLGVRRGVIERVYKI